MKYLVEYYCKSTEGEVSKCGYNSYERLMHNLTILISYNDSLYFIVIKEHNNPKNVLAKLIKK